MSASTRTHTLFFIFALSFSSTTLAEPPSGWVGRKVLTKYGTDLRLGGQVVDDEGRAKEGTNGHERRLGRLYRITAEQGKWLGLQSEDDGANGWVLVSEVVPLEDAIDYYTAEIRSNPSSEAYSGRGTVRYHRNEFDLAIRDYNEAIRLDPLNEVAYFNRGIVWLTTSEYDQAVSDFDQAIKLNPAYASAYRNRGLARVAKGHYDEAISDYDQALRLDPRLAVAYISRGLAWKMKRDYGRAIADLGQAIKIESGNAAYKNALAWLLATCPDGSIRDGRRARALAEAACELTNWKDPGNLDTYAAACAEAGDFDSAVKWQTKALGLLPDGSSDHPGFQSRLDLYKAGKPYRDRSEKTNR